MEEEINERKRHEEILRKISCGIYKISEKRKGRSRIWCLFGEIQNEDGSYIKDLVYCRECHYLFKFNGQQTSNLIRHKCFFRRRHELEAEFAANSEGEKQGKNAKKYKFKDFSLKKLGPKEKQSVVEACSQLETEDCQPFSMSLDSEGFQKLVHTFIRIGAKHGENVDIKNIFADCPKPNSSRAYALSQEKPRNIKQDLERSNEDYNSQTCMAFSQENELEFTPCSDPLSSNPTRPLSTPLNTSLDTTSFNANKTSLHPPKLTYLGQDPWIDVPRRVSEERSNNAKITVTTINEPPPPPKPTLVHINEVDKPADGCTIFADHIACKMRQYSIRTRNIAEHHISNILFDADMGKYEAHSGA